MSFYQQGIVTFRLVAKTTASSLYRILFIHCMKNIEEDIRWMIITEHKEESRKKKNGGRS